MPTLHMVVILLYDDDAFLFMMNLLLVGRLCKAVSGCVYGQSDLLLFAFVQNPFAEIYLLVSVRGILIGGTKHTDLSTIN
jgi:hypothetical protein